jgi:hypothetical protein
MHPTASGTQRATAPCAPTRAIGQPSGPTARHARRRTDETTPDRSGEPIDGIVAMTNAVSAPLPANPWTAPTSSGRRASAIDRRTQRLTALRARGMRPARRSLAGRQVMARKPDPPTAARRRTPGPARRSLACRAQDDQIVPATNSVNVTDSPKRPSHAASECCARRSAGS